MAENKTQKTEASVAEFIESIDDAHKRDDSKAVAALMEKVTGDQPRMWGESIVGFGDFHYRSPAGREGDWFKVGFSPRKQALTLYLSLVDVNEYEGLLGRLGKHTTGKSCLYIKRLEDVDQSVLEELISTAVADVS
jgi:hypothetical protein